MPLQILVVDDDPLMLKLYTRIFSGQDHPFTFADGFAAAAVLIEANHYSMLVTDLQLGDGLGTELARLFLLKFPEARTLLVTGADLGEKKDLDFSCISGCLLKPLDVDKFIDAVAGSTRREVNCLAVL